MKKELQSLLLEVLRAIPTTRERDEVLAALEEAKSQLFSEKNSTSAALQRLPSFIATALPADAASSAQDCDAWLQNLITELAAYPVTTLTVPYLPTVAQTEQLVQRTRQSLGEHVLLQLQTDRKLLAGIRIEHNGKRSEYTLAKELNEQTN